MPNSLQVCAIIPAYNEAAAIGLVVKALLALEYQGQPLCVRVLVCDNASNDETKLQAEQAGAEVVFEARPGYGHACYAGIKYCNENHPEVDTLLFVDGDDSVDYESIPTLLNVMEQGADIVIGSRALTVNEPGALTVPQIFGNRLASFLIGLLWHQKVTDLGPLRLINRNKLMHLNMQEMTFGWTVEMQVKAIAQGLIVREVPSASRRRIGQSKISGTVRGTFLAAYGILGTIAKLWWQQQNIKSRP